MIDTLVKSLPRAIERGVFSRLGLSGKKYLLVTLHRPSNVDHPATLGEILRALGAVSGEIRVIFLVHPRTWARIQHSAFEVPDSVQLIEPLGCLDFLALMFSAALVITDSGGVLEETTFLGVPCLTARANTERPVTIESGTNRLVQSRCEDLVGTIRTSLVTPIDVSRVPALWGGKASRRIVEVMLPK